MRGKINQLRARIIKDIINSEKFYIIYLLRIIDIQIIFCISFYYYKDPLLIYETDILDLKIDFKRLYGEFN